MFYLVVPKKIHLFFVVCIKVEIHQLLKYVLEEGLKVVHSTRKTRQFDLDPRSDHVGGKVVASLCVSCPGMDYFPHA